ncbi:MAG: DUF502 domain-containing protein [Candidatus Omnitrophota bacterium]
MNNKERVSAMQKLRKDFLAGIAIIFPIAVTAYILIIAFKFADGILGKALNRYIHYYFGYKIPGIGIVLGVLLVLFTGMLANRFIGIKLFPVLERFIIKLPILRHIYAPAKQLSNFFFKNNKDSVFNRVVLVPYPNDDTYSIGFMTNDELSEIDAKLGKKIVSVLISTPPSPFSGPIIFVPKEKVKPLDLSMEEAIKFIVSGGLIAPNRYLNKNKENII